MRTAKHTPAADDAALSYEEERKAALGYISCAFEDAQIAGIEPSCVAMVALFKSFAELVAMHGEDATAEFSASLAERIRRGEFSPYTLKH